jgi:predicted nucleotidyltransferase
VIAIYLYGSAVEGGLRPGSDLDLFVVAKRPMTAVEKRTLIDGLLPLSGRHARAGPARSIELTVVVQTHVSPWRYPPTLDLQYGDWLRREFERSELPPWPMRSPDLAVLVTTVLLRSRPLFGPAAAEVLDPVPAPDLDRAMLDSIPDLLADLEPDTANVLLTLARIWTTLDTGEIWSKDAAADRVLSRLPTEHRGALMRARAIYLGDQPDVWEDMVPAVRAHAAYVVRAIRDLAARADVRGRS